MSEIIQALLPLILLVALGAALLKIGFVDRNFCQELDRLVYWVGLPALIIAKVSVADAVADAAVRMAMLLGGVTVGIMALAYLGAKLFRMPPASVGVFAQASFRGNLAFVGLPVVTLATGGSAAAITKASLLLAPTVLLYNILSVFGLIMAHHKLEPSAIYQSLKSMVTNPLLLACATGLLLAYTGTNVPGPLRSTLELLGQTAAPLALLSLGTAMLAYPVGEHVGGALACSVLKLAALPAAVFFIGAWLNLPAEDLQITLIFAATPTAVASYVLASQLGGDRALAAATIIVTTVLSVLSLGAALYWG